MKKKLPWLKYDKLKVEYIQAGKDEATAKKNMEKAVKILQDLNAPIEYGSLFCANFWGVYVC